MKNTPIITTRRRIIYSEEIPVSFERTLPNHPWFVVTWEDHINHPKINQDAKYIPYPDINKAFKDYPNAILVK